MRKRRFALLAALVVVLASVQIARGWPEDSEPIGPDPFVELHNDETISASASSIKVWGHVHNHGSFADGLNVSKNGTGVFPTVSASYNQPWADTWDIEYEVDLSGLSLQVDDELGWLCETLNFDDWYSYSDTGTTVAE